MVKYGSPKRKAFYLAGTRLNSPDRSKQYRGQAAWPIEQEFGMDRLDIIVGETYIGKEDDVRRVVGIGESFAPHRHTTDKVWVAYEAITPPAKNRKKAKDMERKRRNQSCFFGKDSERERKEERGRVCKQT